MREVTTRIKLNCLACGHAMDLAEAYEDYQGEVRCWGCQAILEISMHEGRLQSMTMGPRVEVLDLVAKT